MTVMCGTQLSRKVCLNLKENEHFIHLQTSYCCFMIPGIMHLDNEQNTPNSIVHVFREYFSSAFINSDPDRVWDFMKKSDQHFLQRS